VRTVGVVGAVALVLASAASGRSTVAESAALVFKGSVGNIEAIYAVAGDGTHLTQLSVGPDDSDPTWSPDGSQIAYLRDNGARGLRRSVDLVVLDATGRNPRRITRGALISWFSWSPDSKQIAVADDRRGLVIIDVATASVRSLSKDKSCGPPLWSPDEQMILFAPCLDGLTVISLGDGSSRPLTGTRLARAYAWAPRGSTIAYVASDALFLVEPEGGTPELVTSSQEPDDLAWSPDGTRIAFTSGDARAGEANHVWVLRLADRAVTRLTSAQGCRYDGVPSWSPDSNAIAFARTGCGPTSKAGLYRVSAHGVGERRIARGDPWMDLNRASWDPLGRAVPPKPQLAPPNYLTRIYDARDRRVAYVVRKEATSWAVSWAEDHGTTGVTGSGSHLLAGCLHASGTARRLSPRRWRVLSRIELGPDEHRSSGGEIRRVTPRRWNVYDRNSRKIAATSGPDGPVAGLAWLALRGC
jgi:Tol biopolymer transport system component